MSVETHMRPVRHMGRVGYALGHGHAAAYAGKGAAKRDRLLKENQEQVTQANHS